VPPRGPAFDLLFRRLRKPQRKAHVRLDRHMRVQGVGLKHHRDVTLLGSDIVDDPAADGDASIGNLLQTCNHPQQGGFSASRGADENDEFTVLDVDIDPMQDLQVTIVFARFRDTD
jgi:hypothetical protein